MGKPWKRSDNGDVVISLRTVRMVAITIMAVMGAGAAMGIPMFMGRGSSAVDHADHGDLKVKVATLDVRLTAYQESENILRQQILSRLQSIDGRLANLESRSR